MTDKQPTLRELLEFPCKFTYKVVGDASDDLTDKVISVIQKHAPGNYSPTLKASKNGNFNSVSISITAISIEQVEVLYKELGEIDSVKMVL